MKVAVTVKLELAFRTETPARFAKRLERSGPAGALNDLLSSITGVPDTQALRIALLDDKRCESLITKLGLAAKKPDAKKTAAKKGA